MLSQQLIRRGRGGLLLHQTRLLTHLANHRRQRLPLDQLHRVEVHAPVAADGIDRHDVGVMQQRRRLGLVLEPLQLAGIEGRRERQHLERHPPSQRLLHRLVDHPHPPTGNLPDNQEIPQRLGGTLCVPRPRHAPRDRLPHRVRQPTPHQLQPIQAVAHRLRQLGIPRQVLLPRRSATPLQFAQVFLHHLQHPGIIQRLPKLLNFAGGVQRGATVIRPAHGFPPSFASDWPTPAPTASARCRRSAPSARRPGGRSVPPGAAE